MLIILTLLAYILVVAGYKKLGYLTGIVGNVMWIISGYQLHNTDIIFVNFVFAWVNLYGLYKEDKCKLLSHSIRLKGYSIL